ncbi:uncharacterized protein [Aristolochia californica]|uniref:uncharacterized protein isoform X2 n=1 Tax=Aristolochia californica TaxID=171875 RepID=UPI0035D7C374
MAAISSRRSLPPPGAGGKIRRARRLPPATSPYLRPAVALGPNSSPDSPNRGWLFTASRSVAFAAGKFLSFIRSENSSSSSLSSSTSSSSDGNGENDEYEDVDGLCCVRSKKADDLNMNGILPVAMMSPEEESQSQFIAQDRSRTKLAIEYLLLQETYTREECIKLTKIIQSRVVDDPTNGVIIKDGKDAVLKGLYDPSVGNTTPPSETHLSLSQTRKSPHVFPYSANRWSIFSPKSSVLHASSSDAYKTAIMEAKKWLQEKKSEMNSKSDLDNGPCTLNTDIPSHGNEGDMGSPVDLAKSYMQSRPPWASPSLLNITLKSPSPIRLKFSDDEAQHAMSNHSPFLETAKRTSGFDSSDIHEEIQRVQLKLAESTSEPSPFKQNESSSRLLANVSGETTLVALERSELVGVSQNTDFAEVGNTVTPSGNLPLQLDVDNAATEDRVNLSHEHDVEGNFVATGVFNGPLTNPSFLKIVSNCGEDAVAEKHDFSKHVNELRAACPTLSLQDNNQDLGDACLSQQKVGSGTASHESTVPTAVHTQNIGNTVGELTSNREVLVSQKICCSTPSDTDRPDDHKDAHLFKSSSEMCSAAEKVVDDAIEPHQASLPDLKAYDQVQNGSSNTAEAGESSSSRSSAKSGGKCSKKSQKTSTLSHEVVGVASSQQVHELGSEAFIAVPPDLESNDIVVGCRTRNHTNAFKGHANGNRRKEVGYKRRRGRGK